MTQAETVAHVLNNIPDATAWDELPEWVEWQLRNRAVADDTIAIVVALVRLIAKRVPS